MILAQNSDMLGNFFTSSRFKRKVRLVPRGVKTEAFNPEVPARLHIRQQLNIPAEAVVAGCVAHLVPVKGHPTLLEAAAKVPGIHLLLAGKPLDAEYTRSLENLARSLEIQDRVHFLGGVQDIPGLLTELDIFVLPTWGKWRMEGCPVALLEAMSSGRACIATDIPGSRDLVEPGRSGLLVPPEEVDSMAAALERLTSSPELRRRLGAGARERILQNFTIEKEVAAHIQVYEEILGKIGIGS
jgi:glycosyltransferase involved in cell wall biosynthesis